MHEGEPVSVSGRGSGGSAVQAMAVKFRMLHGRRVSEGERERGGRKRDGGTTCYPHQGLSSPAGSIVSQILAVEGEGLQREEEGSFKVSKSGSETD